MNLVINKPALQLPLLSLLPVLVAACNESGIYPDICLKLAYLQHGLEHRKAHLWLLTLEAWPKINNRSGNSWAIGYGEIGKEGAIATRLRGLSVRIHTVYLPR